MTTATTHNPGEDFGTLEIHLADQDDAAMLWDSGHALIRLPIYAHEARDLMAALAPIAAEEDQ